MPGNNLIFAVGNQCASICEAWKSSGDLEVLNVCQRSLALFRLFTFHCQEEKQKKKKSA